jgi:ornithine cyclodeaminase
MSPVPPAAAPAADRRAPTVVTDEQAARLLSTELLLSTVEATLAQMAERRVLSGDKAVIELDDGDGRRAFLAMPGILLERRVAGVKWVATVARNTSAGLPRAPATIVLTDAVTGMLLGIVEATGLTARRTAAMAAIAAKHCAPPRSGVATILGFGAIGAAAAPLLRALFPLREVRVWGGDPGRLRDRAEQSTRALDIPIVPARDVAQAVAGADIVLAASGLTEDAPFLHRAMLRADAFVCAVGSYQEIGNDVIAAAGTIVVDDWTACTKRGNLAPAIRAGRLTRASIGGELSDLVAGRVARKDRALSLACLIGIGALDVALAAEIVRKATPAPL